MQREAIIEILRCEFPDLLAIYAFGSRIRGDAHTDSDLDMAVLIGGKADPLRLWHIAGKLADIAGCDVDLLDFRAASTVMQYQILTSGERWWVADATQADTYEAFVLSEKTELDTARAGLLADISREGRVHGR